MIVAVCSEKGAPGVTTLAIAMTLAWTGQRILLEADPSGGDATFRLHPPGGQFLQPEPSIMSLARQARITDQILDPVLHAQQASLGISVIPGPPWAGAWEPMRNLWKQVAAALAGWPGTVIADLGRLQPGHPGFPLVLAADVVLLLTTANAEAYFHARERSQELAQTLGGRSAGLNPVAVAVRSRRQDKDAVGQLNQVLQAVGSPVPVIGGVADDPAGVLAVQQGADTPHLRRTALLRSAADLSSRIQRRWPASLPDGPPPLASTADVGRIRSDLWSSGEVR